MKKGMDIKLAVSGQDDVVAAVKATTQALDVAGKVIQEQNRQQASAPIVQQKKEEASAERELAAQKKRATDQAKRDNETIAEYKKRLLQLSKQERDAAFARLDPEEKISKLIFQREQLRAQAAQTSREQERLRLLVREKELQQQIADIECRRISSTGSRTQIWQQNRILEQLRANQTGGPAGAGGAGETDGGEQGGRVSKLLKNKWVRGGLVVAAGMAYAGRAVYRRSVEVTELAGRINDAATQIGVSTEKLQAWEMAAKQSGAELSNITGGFRKMSKEMVKAVGGNNESVAAFQRLGISLKDLKTKSQEAIFEQLAKGVEKAEPSAQQMVDLMKVLGASADDLIPVFRSGFGAAAEEASRAGAIIDTDLVAKLDEIGDKFTLLARSIIVAFAPIAVKLGEIALQIIRPVRAAIIWTSTYARALLDGYGFSAANKQAKAAVAQLPSLELTATPIIPKPRLGALDAEELLRTKQQAKEEKEAKREAAREERRKAMELAKAERKDALQRAREALASQRQADDLARIGLYRGGSSGPSVQDQLKEHTRRLDMIYAELQKANVNLTKEE